MSVSDLVRRGHELSAHGSYPEAEVLLRAAVADDPGNAMAWNNLGWVRQRVGDPAEAEACYREALARDGGQVLARRNLCRLLIAEGNVPATRPLLLRELDSGDSGFEWCTELITRLFVDTDFAAAGEVARILAEVRWSSPAFPLGQGPVAAHPAGRFLTAAKLRHDAEQLAYLAERDLLGFDVSGDPAAYERIAARLEQAGIDRQVPLSDGDEEEIGEVYNRIIHVRETPRVTRALSTGWDGARVAEDYRAHRGVVVIDDFLTGEALRELRAFCLESTVWTANRYGHGRLGAFFHDGFNCPLLLQIAEELRNALPTVLRPEYPLRQVWAFKNGYKQPAGSTLHADFASVNVNFWITPESANREPETGGLDVYDSDAPLWWDFAAYNGRADLMRSLLESRRATVTKIPYRENRALVFNSDLFHATQGVDFRTGYANRRINVTFLFGDRENDRDFPQAATPTDSPSAGPGGVTVPWRSRALRSSRRGR